MKYAVLILLLIFSPGLLAQKPKPKSPPVRKLAAAKPAPTPLTEKQRFEKASAHELAADRVAALEKFLADFPESTNRPAAADLLASSRLLIADEMFLSGDAQSGIASYRRIVEAAPRPLSNDLFNETIGPMPATLFRRGHREAAVELATLIESKVEDNAGQLLEIAKFFLNIERGSEAMRVAAKAAARDPNSAAVHRTLALAHRINFDLVLSADSYAKALELEPDSIAAKRGQADMNRAIGKSDEAVALYRDLLAKDEKDVTARTGLILALFDAGKRSEAETELVRTLEETPGNFVLMAGAAYWYAAKGEGNRAVELAQKAVAREPRYIWSHIALARGLMRQGKPVAAEQALIKARAYGNFPTLEYEIASARAAAGFYRDAAEDLSKYFSVTTSGVKTNLGGRISREEKSLMELVAQERRASIFAPDAADTVENAETLRALLELHQRLAAAEPSESEIARAADAFANVNDRMKVHRQVYAATQLLEKRIAVAKVLELARAATGNTDAALEVGDPGAAVMASELYEPRAIAFRKNEFLLVPEVPKPTLSAIIRGKIEEIAGWALYQQNSYGDAIVRLRRAVSVMPKDSAWWRSSMWRLGAALAADGKESEGLAAYIDSYKIDKPDWGKYAVVEALYRKVNGTTDGLEAKIGRERVAILATSTQPDAPPPADSTTSVSTAPVEPPKVDAEMKATETGKQQSADETSRKPESSDEKPPVAKEPAKEEPVKEEPVKPDPAASESPKPEPAVTESPKPEPEKAEPKQTEVAKPEQPTDAQVTKTKTESAAGETGSPASGPGPEAKKPLFEPIIITIPDRRARVVATNQPPKEEPKAVAEAKSGDTQPSTEPKPVADKPVEIEEKPVEAKTEIPPCTIDVGQESISLINNGGTVGLLVHLRGGSDIKELTAVSSSPQNIEVIRQPEIVGFPDRLFFVVKSVSESLGVYQIHFTAPCGKKEIVVNVR